MERKQIPYQGKWYTQTELAKKFGLAMSTLSVKLSQGKSIEEIARDSKNKRVKFAWTFTHNGKQRTEKLSVWAEFFGVTSDQMSSYRKLQEKKGIKRETAIQQTIEYFFRKKQQLAQRP